MCSPLRELIRCSLIKKTLSHIYKDADNNSSFDIIIDNCYCILLLHYSLEGDIVILLLHVNKL